jgi:LysR family cyn operon transcriptional activator
MTLDAMVLALAADEVDLGMAFSAGQLPDLECEPMFNEELTVVVGASHPFARRRAALTPALLDGAAMALLNTSFATRTHADAYFQAQGVVPRVAIEANTISALLEIIRREDIATILPCTIAAAHSDLRALALSPPPPGRTVVMMHRRDSYRSAAATAFAVQVRDWMRAGRAASTSSA